MTRRDRFLQQLAEGNEALAMFVEDLRSTASILDGSYPFDNVTRIKISHQLAVRLRDVAQQLCDHARISGDGRCRYCEAKIG